MAEGNQPRERNLAAEAFRKNYSALHDALAQPGVAGVLATKLYSGAIITSETRDAVQMSSFTPTQQANCLLQAVESSIKIDHTRLRKFTRVLKKQPVLKPIARQLRQCYSELVCEARLTESSSSGSDTDSAVQSQAAMRPTAAAGTHTASPDLPALTTAFSQTNESMIRGKFASLLEFVQKKLQQTLGAEKVEHELRMFIIILFDIPDESSIPMSSDVAVIFKAMRRHKLLTYLNVAGLEQVIKHFCNDDSETESKMEQYRKDRSAFELATKIKDYISKARSKFPYGCDESASELQPKRTPAYLTELAVKLEHCVADYHLNYLRELWKLLSSVLSLPPLYLILDAIIMNSVLVVWLIPTDKVPKAIERAKQNADFFRKYPIVKVTIGDECVYSKTEPTGSSYPSLTQKSSKHPGHFRGLLNQMSQHDELTSLGYAEIENRNEKGNLVGFTGVVTFTHQGIPKKFKSRGVHAAKSSACESAAEEAFNTIGGRRDRGGNSTMHATPSKPLKTPTIASPKSAATSVSPSNKTPVMKLKELCEQRKWPQPTYTAVPQLGEQRFQFQATVKTPTRPVTAKGSVCGSKTEAKHSAAQAALQDLETGSLQMAISAAPVSASSDRTNFFRVCRVVLDHIPKVLRDVFKDEVRAQYGYPWNDGVQSGTWLRGREKWTRRIGSEQRKLLDAGNSAEWDPTLIFQILLYSSLCLFVEEIPATTFHPKPKQIVSVSFPGSLGSKVIIQGRTGDSIHIVEIINSSPTCLQLDKSARIFALPTAKVYRCKSEWYVVDSLRIMRNEKFAHVMAASVSDSDFKQFVMDVEDAYTRLLGKSVSCGVIAELKQIGTEEIIDPDTEWKYKERMELEVKRYDELALRLQEQEQHLNEHSELINKQGEQIENMEMEWKSADAEMADQIEFNTEQITRSKFEREKMTSDISSLVERMDCMEGKMTQQSQTFESKHEKISSEVGGIKERVDRVEEQVAKQGRDLSIQKSEHAKMTGEMSAMKRKVEQIDKTVAQHGSALAWLEQQQNIKWQFEFTSKPSEDGSSRHRCTITYMKGGHLERPYSEYFSTENEAAEQVAQKIRREFGQSRPLAVTVSKTETLKTPNIFRLEELYKLRGKILYDTKSCKGGYQSTVFVPQSGSFRGGVCRSRERAKDDAARQALQELDKL